MMFSNTELNYNLIVFATISAFIGVYIGNKFLQKITLGFVQNTVAFLLLAYGILLIFGII